MDNLNDETDSENIFRILIATDIHLGFAENDPIRGEDTFNSFEEILQHAVKEEVDFILLGGDLFHDARPSPYCLNKCTELIRKYCLGEKSVQIEFLSDASYNFPHAHNPVVNYDDTNLNVSIPIFSIHGNHDDPTGKRQVSAMDLLSSMGLLNYFGRWDNLTHVQVKPILLRKGRSLLGLYGLSHIRDDRLSRLFLDGKVTMDEPDEVWFNLLVWHQNRADRGAKNFISEFSIPDFMDLVVWGHEHDCRINAVTAQDGNAYITQPGSSVATSLAAGESISKKIGLLLIKNRKFKLNAIELKTVRPFIYKDFVLELPKDSDDFESTIRFSNLSVNAQQQVDTVIEQMIDESKYLGRKEGLIPLLRLAVKYKDERQVFNAIRYSQKYVGIIANPQDMIIFSKSKSVKKDAKTTTKSMDILDEVDQDNISRVEDLIPMYFDENNKLEFLSMKDFIEGVKKFVDGNDLEAIKLSIDRPEEDVMNSLVSMSQDEEDVERNFGTLQRKKHGTEVGNEIKTVNDSELPTTSNANDSRITLSDDEEEGNKNEIRKGRGAGRGSRSSRGTKARRGSQK